MAPRYLLGRRFVIKTDQQSLKFIMEQRQVGHEYQKWVSKLMGYTFDIQYRPGAANQVADALSRINREGIECCNLVATCVVPWEKLQSIINNDPFIQQVKQDLAAGNAVPKGYSLRQDILYFKDRIVLPSTRNITDMFLKEYHDSLIGGMLVI